MPPKSKKAPATMAELVSLVKEGRYNAIPDEVIVRINSLSREDFEILLEILRLKSFGHELVQKQLDLMQQGHAEAISPIQKVQSLIHNGRYAEAMQTLKSGASSGAHADADMQLEKARSLVFLGRFEDSAALVRPLAFRADLSADSRAAASQILGHALQEQGLLQESRTVLQSALDTARIIGNSQISSSAEFFLARQEALEGDFSSAYERLATIFDVITKHASLRQILGAYRTQFQIQALQGDARCAGSALLSLLLARSMGDELFMARSALELAWVLKKFKTHQNSAIHQYCDQIFAQQASKEDVNQSFDVKVWREMGSASASADIKAFLPHRIHAATCQGALPELPQALDALQWFHDSSRELAVDLMSCEISPLQSESPIARLLAMLSVAAGPVSASDVFTKVWGLNFDPARHDGLLKVTCGRVAKLGAAFKIVREKKELKMQQPGWVCQSLS